MSILQDNKLSSNFISAQNLIKRKKDLPIYPVGVKTLDLILDGGISPGKLYEFGMPPGFEGRKILMSLLKGLTEDKVKVIWISPSDRYLLNPAMFFAHNVDLSCIRFAFTNQPLEDLKALFFESLFQVIILDSPGLIKKDIFSFLNKQTRENRQIILILRDYLLKNEIGNIWSQARINCYPERSIPSSRYESDTRPFFIKLK